MYYFYVLKSEKDFKYYYGSTSDLKRRLREHNNGKVSATSYRRPFSLTYYEAYENLHQARLREQQVKASGSVRKQLQNRIESPDSSKGPARPPAGNTI